MKSESPRDYFYTQQVHTGGMQFADVLLWVRNEDVGVRRRSRLDYLSAAARIAVEPAQGKECDVTFCRKVEAPRAQHGY